MAGGGVVGVRGEEVLELDDAVKLLVEQLVEPVLSRGAHWRETALVPEKQKIVARQVHAMVVLYNYYHRKQFPQLDFADPKRFSKSASLAGGEALHVYLNHVHDRGGNDAAGGSNTGAGLSVTDKAVIEACGIAEAFNAKLDAPKITMWPISKIAVLLIDPTRKQCLVENSSLTQGVWSIPEKDIITACGNSCSMELLRSEALEQTAYSLVEAKTGMKRTSLRFLEEHLVYSLSQKETTAKLFVVQYEETINYNLRKMSLEDLIERISGPVCRIDPYPTTTSVVEFYHILPYKEVLLNLRNSKNVPKEHSFRKEKSSLHSEIDENVKGQEANSKSNIKNITPDASVPKKYIAVKEVGNNDTNNLSTRKKRKHSKRKSEALEASPATCTKHRGEESSRKGNDSLSYVETLKVVNYSANEATQPTSGGLVNLQTSLQNDENRIEKQNAPEVDPLAKNHASENPTMKVEETSGIVTDNINDQMYESLQLLQKMQNDNLREHRMIVDQCAQVDMAIQTILTEGKITPRAMSIMTRYKNNSSNETRVVCLTNPGNRSRTMDMKRRKLNEAILLHSNCQELDDICQMNNWMLPRYTVFPSVIEGLYQACVQLVCTDLPMSALGDMKTTPCEARESAAAAMLYQLRLKAKENQEEQGTPNAALHDETTEK